MNEKMHTSWQALKRHVDPGRALYLVAGAVIVLFALQSLGIVLVRLNIGSPVEVPVIVVAGISFFAGLLVGVIFVTWKSTRDGAEQQVEATGSEPAAHIPEPVAAPAAASADSATVADAKPDPAEIPVEGLASGVVHALGDGLGAVVDTGKSAGSSLASGVRDGAGTIVFGAEAAVSRAKAGLGVVYNFAYRQACREADNKAET